MAAIEWGAEPEFFGPRHAHRERRIAAALSHVAAGPGRHLECAAGVGSLSITLARHGKTVVAADSSLRSLAVVRRRVAAADLASRVLPVLADITKLPFRDAVFSSTTTAETLEHIPDDRAAVTELARILAPRGWLVGTVPAGPEQWTDWDDWAGHLRRYTAASLAAILRDAGLEPRVTTYGWPLLRLYDAVFLRRVIRRRHRTQAVDEDPTLRAVAGLGRRRTLVRAVMLLFSLDRLFDGAPWGVGVTMEARKPAVVDRPSTPTG